MALLIDPLVSFDLIDRDELNRCLVDWGHQHGPLNRPEFSAPVDFGMRLRGELVGVVAADTLIRPTCGLDRTSAFEVSRVCGCRRGLSPLVLRCWREFAYPDIVRAWGTPWAISYQDATRHSGGLYRYDGWLILGYSSGGADPRAASDTVTARRRVIWGWHGDAAARAERRATVLEAPRWAA